MVVKKYSYISVLLAIFLPAILFAQEDTLFFQYLEESYVSEYKNTSMLKSNTIESVSFNVESLDKFPKLFGQSDPIRFVQTLPGVQTAAITDPGVNVLGCNNSQNEFYLAGAPFYPTSRLLGLFPTINTDAFSEIKFKSCSDVNNLGGHLSWDLPDSLVTKTHLNASVGMISAQATVNVPIGTKVDLTASLRKSYLNLIYGSLLRMDGGSLVYGFHDANLSAKWKPNEKNTFDATVFFSQDLSNVNYFGLGVDGDWNNKLAVLRWRHKGDVRQEHVIYASDSPKTFSMEQKNNNGYMKSYRREIGYRGDIVCPFEIHVRPEFTYYENLPQSVYMSNDFKSQQEVQSKQNTLLGTISIDRRFDAGNFSIIPKVIFNGYKELGYEHFYFNIDPSVTLEYNMYDKGTLSLDLGRKHQYFTELTALPSAVPIQFWVANGHYNDPQESLYAALSYSIKFNHGMWGLSSQVYYKDVRNQLEFCGFYLTMALSNYRLEDYLLHTRGKNYGLNVMFSKNSGNLTGWISYSYGRALRTTDEAGYPYEFPATYERPHEFNILASYKLGQFDLSGTLVAASGTPYTPIKYFYFYQDMFLSEFDEFNSARLKPYFRLDLSATWNFKTKGNFEHGVNLSVYNATAANAGLGYRLVLDDNTGTFQYRQALLIIDVIPSLSYFIKF